MIDPPYIYPHARVRVRLAVRLTLCLLLGLAVGGGARGADGHANRLPTWAPARFDAQTTGLFAFDGEGVSGDAGDGRAANANPTGVAARLLGAATPTAEGRFGGAVALRGDGRIEAESPTRNLTVALQLRPEALPAGDGAARLLALQRGPSAAGALQLWVEADGRLRLDAYGLREARSAEPVIVAGTWQHLALVCRAAYVNKRWQGDVEVLVDGRSVIRLVNQPKLVNQQLTDAVIGGDGLAMTVDDLQVSAKDRAYYANDLAWVQAGEPLRVAAAPPYLRAGLAGSALDFEDTLQATPLAGVQGRAASIGSGAALPSAALEGPTAARGTVALWLRPLDWDNLARTPPYASKPPPRMVLFSLLDRREGLGDDGKAKALLEMGAFLAPSTKLAAPLSLTPGAWRHVALVWDGDLRRVYVDGELTDGQGLVVKWPQGLPDTAAVRALRWDDAAPVRTAVDELRVFDRALSPPEIANLVAMVDPRRTATALPALLVEADVNGVLGTGAVTVWRLAGGEGEAEAGAGKEQPCTVSLFLERENNQTLTEPLYETQATLPASGVLTIPVEPGPLAFGSYRWQVQVGDAKGEARVTRSQPPWWGNTLGEEPTVPPGWTAMTVERTGDATPAQTTAPAATTATATIGVVGRRVHLAASGLPARIESAGGEILAAPIGMSLRVGGQDQTLTPLPGAADSAPGPTIDAATPARVEWHGAAASDSVRLTTAGSMEFDGMIWLDFTLEPRAAASAAATAAAATAGSSTAAPVQLDSLTIEIPYAPGAAELYQWWSGDMFFGDGRTFRSLTNTNTGAALPAGQGLLFRSNDADTVRLPPELRGSFLPYVMLTGMARGMAWFAESDRGWTPNAATPAVRIERRGETVVLVLHIVSEPVALTGPRRFAFGLHPVPVKPLPANWRRHDGMAVYPDAQTGNILKGDETHHFDLLPADEDWDAVAARLSGLDSTEPFAGRMQADAAARAAAVEAVWGAPPVGFETRRPALYWNQAWIGNLPPHSREWQAAWYRRMWVTYDDDFLDYASWAMDQWLTHCGDAIAAIYMDDLWASPQLEGPYTYTMADGHVQPGWQWRAYRQRYLRMRRIFVAHGIDPVLVGHDTNTTFMPYMGMFDIAYDGEWRYATPPKQDTFLDRWPADRLRFAEQRKWGFITSWLGWGGAGESSYRAEYPAWAYRQARAWAAALTLHDIDWPVDVGNTYQKPADIDRQLGMRDAKTVYLPYWGEPIVASGAVDGLAVSAWKRPDGSALLLLVNHGDAPLDAALTLNLATLGLAADVADGTAPGAAGRLALRDVDPSLTDLSAAAAGSDATTIKPAAAPGDALADGDLLGDALAAPADPAADAGGGLALDLGLGDELGLDAPAAPGKRAKPGTAAASTNPDLAVSYTDGVLRCRIRPDDFRLLELRSRKE